MEEFKFKEIRAKYYGGKFKQAPWLLVIHSGANAPGIAEFFSKVGYISRRDGGRIHVSAHVSFSRGENDFVQCVPFARVAFHAGGSVFDGMRGVNQFSIGLELPGPNSKLRDEAEKEKFRRALGIILMRVPSITTVVRHKDIDSHKRDPGNGFDKTWVDGFGLKIAW